MSECSKRISIKELINYINKNWKNYDGSESILVNSSDDENCAKAHANFYPLKLNLSTKLDVIGNNLDDILSKINDDFCRIGILTNIDDMGDADISLYSSILWVLKDGFSNSKKQVQSECVKEFIKVFKLGSQSVKFDEFKYKSMGWTYKQLLEDIKSGDVGTTVIRYLADYLHVNIFILNVGDGKLYYSGSSPWVHYKKNVLLVRHSNNNFEPIFTDQTKVFGVESKLVSYLLMKPHVVEVMYCDLNSKESKKFKDGDEDLNAYIINDNDDIEESEAMNKFDESTEVSVNLNDSSESESDNEDIQNMVYSNRIKKSDSPQSEKLSDMSYDNLKQEAKTNGVDLYCIRGGKRIQKKKSKLLAELENVTSNHSNLDENTSQDSTDDESSDDSGDDESSDDSGDDESSDDSGDDESSNNSNKKVPNYKSYKVPELRTFATNKGILIKQGNKFKTKQELTKELDKLYK